MDEKIEKILQESTYKFTPEQYNAALKDAKSMDTRSWIEKYQPEFEKDRQLAVAWKAAGLDKYGKDKWERYREAFGSSDTKNPFNRSDNWLKATWQNDFSDIPYEQYKKDIELNKKYWEDEKRAREYNAGRVRRAKEIKDADLISPWTLASEYEKRRYIEHPERALFGKESPKVGAAEDTRWGSLADLGLGAAGVAADVGTSFLEMNPVTFGIASVTGPAVRAGRDILHKAVDSPYQKDWSEIGSDFKTDVAENAAVEGFANLRTLSRGAKNVGTGNIELVLDNAKLMKDADQILKTLPEAKNLGKYSNTDLFKMIQSLPESDIKTQFKNYAKNAYEVDKVGIANELSRLSDLKRVYTDPSVKQGVIKNMNEGNEAATRIGERAYESNIVFEPKLNKREKVGKAVIGTVEKIPSKAGGVLKASTEIDAKPLEENKQLIKDWYKQNYARDWSLDKPFKPNKKEDDPLWEAYVEFRKEHNLEP